MEECIDAIKEVKNKDIKIIKQELYKTEPNAKICNGVSFTFRYFTGTKNNFFKVAVNLWHNIEGDLKVEYQKYLMQKIWNKVKESEQPKQQQQSPLSSWAKVICNGLATYKPVEPVVKRRREPIYIDTDTAYAKADIDMTLDGYGLQQILKQHKDDFSGPKDHPRLRDDDDWNKYRVKEDW